MAFIYKITNTINGKAYIGKTEGTVEKRWKEHCKDSARERCKNRPLYRALNKYGIEAFTVETLEETTDVETREIFWIEHYETYKLGYNATKGGDGKSYVDIELLERVYSELGTVTAVALKTGHDKCYIGSLLKQVGVVIKPSSVQNKIKTQKGVICVETGEIFDSQRDVARYVRPDATPDGCCGVAHKISLCCRGLRKTAYGFTWKYI